MVRSNCFFAGMAVLFALNSADRIAFASDDDDPKAPKKQEKKIEMPKLPEGSNPKWDLESVEEKFTVIKGSLGDKGDVTFLLELKEDMASTPRYEVVFTDSEGVKFFKRTCYFDPMSGKKGDRVRLIFIQASPADYKEKWLKAVKVQIVAAE